MYLNFNILTTLIIVLMLFGQAHATNNKDKDIEHTPPSQPSMNLDTIPVGDVQRFTAAISQIKRYYVDAVKDSKLFEDAIRGMLEGLDPHSAYLDIEDFKELNSSTRGHFGGLGIEVTMENGIVKIIAPIDDTPAFKAGLKSGDYIIKLDQKTVRGMKLKDAVNMMRGKKGTPIQLTVLRKGEVKPLIFKIVRDIIQVQSVKK